MASNNIWAYAIQSLILCSLSLLPKSLESNDVFDTVVLWSKLRLTYDVDELAECDRYRRPRSLEQELLRCRRRLLSACECKWSLWCTELMHFACPLCSHFELEFRRADVDALWQFFVSDALLLHVSKCCSFDFFFSDELWFFKLNDGSGKQPSCLSIALTHGWLVPFFVMAAFKIIVLSPLPVTVGMLSKLLYWCVKTNSTDFPWVFFWKIFVSYKIQESNLVAVQKLNN